MAQTQIRSAQVLDSSLATADLGDDSVTYAKIQNASAASRLLGRGNGSGAGDYEEISFAGFGLQMAGTSLRPEYGSSFATVCEGDDARLSDSRAASTIAVGCPITASTATCVLYVNASNLIGQDSVLAYNDSTKRLGVGVSSPGRNIDTSHATTTDGSDGIRVTSTASDSIYNVFGQLCHLRSLPAGSFSTTGKYAGSFSIAGKADVECNLTALKALVVTGDSGTRNNVVAAMEFCVKEAGSLALPTVAGMRLTGSELACNRLANGQEFTCKTLTELTTIAAAATTDTAITIPANAVVFGVSVRNTVAIPTAATYTVTGTTSGTVFNTVAVAVAINTTDPGTKAGTYYNGTAQTVRITPSLTPANNNGRVRITVHFYTITPPTS